MVVIIVIITPSVVIALFTKEAEAVTWLEVSMNGNSRAALMEVVKLGGGRVIILAPQVL